MKKTLTIILLFFALFYTRSQNQTYAVETIAFYNVENLFDHYDDPKTRDDDRTPDGRDRWTCLLYTSPSPRDRLLSRMPSSA